MEDVRLMLGDCLEVMGGIEDGSVDMILADLPYGTTACKWDTVIPLEPLWAHYKRVIKRNGAIVLTASQPFTSALVMSNPKWFKYAWVWDKCAPTGHLNVKRQPMQRHNDVLVFASEVGTYNPQLRSSVAQHFGRIVAPKSDVYGKHGDNVNRGVGYPVSIITFPRPSNLTDGGQHPTQKPVALMEYLIRTYTNEGELVLDNAMGSGTTGVACIQTGRRFIGIERDEGYYNVACKRIQEAQSKARQLTLEGVA